ncbi:hypothetical protein KDM41_05185 [bacterium]|nr:hypothetical protein [bacterium]
MRFPQAITAVAALASLLIPALASAQASRPPIEVSATYGSMWGGNIETYQGKLRTGTGGALGIAVDVPIRPGMWVEAGYTRQDGSLDWDPRIGSKFTLSNMSVNFWHIGTVRALGRPGSPVMPFVTGSLGATYFSPSEATAVIDGDTYDLEGLTKFSVAFGAGFKAYFGEAKKVGLRGQFKVYSTIFDAGGGVWFGPGGVDIGVSGSGIWQFEAAGGLTVKFGG